MAGPSRRTNTVINSATGRTDPQDRPLAAESEPLSVASARNRRRGAEPTLEELLWSESHRFEFFQAVRLLAAVSPGRRPVGLDHLPQEEVVRFRGHPALHFPASEIFEIEPPTEERPPTMEVTFFGLFGPQGALPDHYTRTILDRALRRDTTLRDFLDLFNHRLISLFYRAWEKYRFWVQHEQTLRRELETRSRPDRFRAFIVEERPKRDRFSQILLDLAGLGMPSLRYRTRVRHELQPRTAVNDQTFRFYSGLLARNQRPAVGLEGLLHDYFGWPVRVLSFCGQWLRLDPEDQTELVPGGNAELGCTAVAGDRVWDVQSKFRVSVGPLGYDEFCRLLPIGEAYRPMTDLTRVYAGMEFDFDLQLLLRTAEVPWCRLGAAEGLGSRLGWNTWIRSGEFEQNAVTVEVPGGDR